MRQQFDAACRQYGVKTAQGNGEAEWPDGLKSGFPSVAMLGKVEQQTYTGKNLFNILGIEAHPGWEQGIISVDENGLVVRTKEDYTSNGNTPTQKRLQVLAPDLVAGKTYTLSLISDSLHNNFLYLVGSGLQWTNGNSRVITDADLASEVYVYGFRQNNGEGTGDCRISNIQIEEGPVATVYEPYVGAIPAPNPWYPQRVKANNATVQSCGKNLFNISLIPVQDEVIDQYTCWISEVGSDYVVVSESDIYIHSGAVGTGLTLRQLAPGLVPGQRYTLQFETESKKQDSIWLREAKTLWARGKSLTMTEELLDSEVCLFGKSVYDGEPRGDCRISHIQIEKGYPATSYQPYHNGERVTAPPLMCAVDGSCQSTYDPQTGEFVNWWWDKITLDGSEEWRPYGSETGVYHGFEAVAVLPERTTRAAYWCNQCKPDVKGHVRLDGSMNLWCGVTHNYLYVLNTGFEDYSLEDWGLANWKAHLEEHPLEIWMARSEPEITNIGPNRLTCPTGYGKIKQVAGDIPDCPLEVKYLAHGGHVQ